MDFDGILNGITYFIFIVTLILFGIQFGKLLLGFWMNKRAGKLLYKDSSLNPELVMAAILIIVLIIVMVITKKDLIFWLIMLFIGVLFGIKGFARLEIREKGVFIKDGFWEWKDIKSFEFETSDKLYNLKLIIKNRSHKLTIDYRNKSRISDLLKANIRKQK